MSTIHMQTCTHILVLHMLLHGVSIPVSAVLDLVMSYSMLCSLTASLTHTPPAQPPWAHQHHFTATPPSSRHISQTHSTDHL
jgi:hypothetical protein